jgi:hypothetical protein
VDALFFGNIGSTVALANAFGVQTTLTKARQTDWSSLGSVSAWLTNLSDPRQARKPAMDYIKLNGDSITAGAGNDIAVGDNAYVMPVVNGATAAGAITAMRILPIGEPGATQASTLRYSYDYGAFGRLHRTADSDVNLKAIFRIDNDTINGDAGNDVLFGLQGDDAVFGGDNDDTISGGNGFDRVNGGRGNNVVAFDRTRDVAEKGGGKDSVKQTVDASANSTILGRNWTMPQVQGLAADINRANASGTLFGVNSGRSSTPAYLGQTIEGRVQPAPKQPFSFVTGADPSRIVHTPIDLANREIIAEYHSARPLPSDLIDLLKSGDITVEVEDEDRLAYRDDLDHWAYDILTGTFVSVPTVSGARSSGPGTTMVFNEATGTFVTTG